MAEFLAVLFGGLWNAASAVLLVPVAAFALGYLARIFLKWSEDRACARAVLNSI